MLALAITQYMSSRTFCRQCMQKTKQHPEPFMFRKINVFSTLNSQYSTSPMHLTVTRLKLFSMLHDTHKFNWQKTENSYVDDSIVMEACWTRVQLQLKFSNRWKRNKRSTYECFCHIFISRRHTPHHLPPTLPTHHNAAPMCTLVLKPYTICTSF